MIHTDQLTGSGTYTVPGGVHSITVIGIGSGAFAQSNGFLGSVSGNGGDYASVVLAVSPGDTFPYQVGPTNASTVVHAVPNVFDTWFGNANPASASCKLMARAGFASQVAPPGDSKGDVVRTGGIGGQDAVNATNGGGGGAAGPHGNGANGGKTFYTGAAAFDAYGGGGGGPDGGTAGTNAVMGTPGIGGLDFFAVRRGGNGGPNAVDPAGKGTAGAAEPASGLPSGGPGAGGGGGGAAGTTNASGGDGAAWGGGGGGSGAQGLWTPGLGGAGGSGALWVQYFVRRKVGVSTWVGVRPI